MTGIEIVGTGRCVPSRLVTNDDLSRFVETSDEWIRTRTGIAQRYFCAEGESNAQLAAGAARAALERAGISAEKIGLCVAATFTADHAMPSLACEVHEALSLPESAPAFDVNAACTGFITALETARSLLAGGSLKGTYALVIGSEAISRVLDMTDRNTCVLFGDGAGAAVIRLSDNHAYHCVMGARGDVSLLRAGGAGCDERFVHMEGKAVFRFASDTVPKCVMQVLDTAGLTMEDIDYVVCHQANGRIIDHVMKKLNAPAEKFYKNMQSYANTSAASIAIALDEMNEKGLLKPGTRIVCVGFGAGLTWGGTLLTF